MDFFAHQDRARRNTTLLVVYFAMAVVGIVLTVYAAAQVLLFAGAAKSGARFSGWWNPETFVAVAGLTVLVIVLGTLYKVAQLRSGGEAVARMLGGRPLVPGNADTDERRVLNVVEEMAIASGTPVPPVFIMDHEEGINAFAAGYSPADAVIGVTRGCVRTLNRDELQGVIAHEFSHILNGDMRLNIRLIGILNGIVLIAMIGYQVVRIMAYGGGHHHRSRSSRGSGKEGGGRLAIFLFGVALIGIGSIGMFFANLIRSAVSRQREFLADASAVQFTRNPGGIAGALKKIGGLVQGSRVDSPKAPEAGHLFFGNALRNSWFSLLATHPPLAERIRRIDPSFDGDFRRVRSAEGPAGASGMSELSGHSGPMPPPVPRRRQADAAMARVGTVSPNDLACAAALRFGLPENAVTLAREPFGAVAVIYSLLIDADPAIRERQLAGLAPRTPDGIPETVRGLLEEEDRIPPEHRLPLLDLAMPALDFLSPGQMNQFRENIAMLAEADEQIDLFEYVMQRVIQSRIDAKSRPPAKARSGSVYSLRSVEKDCVRLLSALAHIGAREPGAEEVAFRQAVGPLGTMGAAGPLPADRCGLAEIDASLHALANLAPPLKGKVFEACVRCILADRDSSVEETELLRAIAATLDIPMPPFFAEEAQG